MAGRRPAPPSRDDRQFTASIDERGHDDPAAAFRQPAGNLAFRGYSSGQPDQRLRRLFAIGNDDDARPRLPPGGLEPQAFAVHALEYRPPNRIDVEAVPFAHQSRLAGRRHQFNIRKLEPCLPQPDQAGQSDPVGFDRRGIGGGGGNVPPPVACPRLDRHLGLAEEEPVDSRDHRLGDVSLQGERLGAREFAGPGRSRCRCEEIRRGDRRGCGKVTV